MVVVNWKGQVIKLVRANSKWVWSGFESGGKRFRSILGAGCSFLCKNDEGRPYACAEGAALVLRGEKPILASHLIEMILEPNITY